MKDFYELPLIIKRRPIFEEREGDPTSRETRRSGRDNMSTANADSIMKKMGMDSFEMRGSTKKEKALNFLKKAIDATFSGGDQYLKYLFDEPIVGNERSIIMQIARYKSADGRAVHVDKIIKDEDTSRKLCMGFIRTLLSAASNCRSPKIEWDKSRDKTRVGYSAGRRAAIIIEFRE